MKIKEIPMKKSSIILSLLAAGAVVFSSCKENKEEAQTQGEKPAIEKGSIVYFNLDRVLDEYDMANEKRSEVETKIASIEKEVMRRQKSLEDAAKDFQNKINKGLMTTAAANEKSRKLQQQEQAYNQFAQQKQQEIMEEQQVMMNQLADAIKTFMESYNEEKGYAMILSNTAGVPVIVGDPALDITDDVIAGLNAEYIELKKSEN